MGLTETSKKTVTKEEEPIHRPLLVQPIKSHPKLPPKGKREGEEEAPPKIKRKAGKKGGQTDCRN